MSNSKISALPSASTPLAGTEVLPVVQGGITEQVSVADLTAGRAISASSITLTTALAATSGGTGNTSAFVANAIPYASSTTVLSTSANWTYNGTNAVLLNGAFGVGVAPSSGQKFRVGGTFASSGNEAVGMYVFGTADTSSTSAVNGIYTTLSTADGITGVTNLRHFYAVQGTITGGTRVAPTNQFGYVAHSSLTGATNNYGFYSQIASAANRYNFYAVGTAPNWFSGDVLVFGAGGLGYTTGSGGTVTQGTSRTTGVTLNKTNGAITLFSAAGSTTFQSFTVTNSTVAATDVIHVVQKSGTDKYAIWVTNVSAGSFQLTYATLSGTTTEQPVFNFAVVKAVAA